KNSRLKIGQIHDGIPLEDIRGPVSSDLHRYALGCSNIEKVPYGCASEIVSDVPYKANAFFGITALNTSNEESQFSTEGEGLRVFRSMLKASFAAQSGPRARRMCREETAILGRADHVVLAAGGRRHGRRRRLPPGRDLGANVLSLEEGLRRDAPQRGARA